MRIFAQGIIIGIHEHKILYTFLHRIRNLESSSVYPRYQTKSKEDLIFSNFMIFYYKAMMSTSMIFYYKDKMSKLLVNEDNESIIHNGQLLVMISIRCFIYSLYYPFHLNPLLICSFVWASIV